MWLWHLFGIWHWLSHWLASIRIGDDFQLHFSWLCHWPFNLLWPLALAFHHSCGKTKLRTASSTTLVRQTRRTICLETSSIKSVHGDDTMEVEIGACLQQIKRVLPAQFRYHYPLNEIPQNVCCRILCKKAKYEEIHTEGRYYRYMGEK